MHVFQIRGSNCIQLLIQQCDVLEFLNTFFSPSFLGVGGVGGGRQCNIWVDWNNDHAWFSD